MNSPSYRPPAEAGSLILQIDEGCPYNRCTFCSMYSNTPYKKRSLDEIREIVTAESQYPAKRIFLADGDVLRRPFEELRDILELLNETFPSAVRINTYATGSAILDKTPDQLRILRNMKLHTLYMGLESGDEPTLQTVRKGESASKMIQAAKMAQSENLHMSVMVLLGLAGADRSEAHAANTAKALNQMQPRLLSFLRVVPIPGSGFQKQIESGEITQLSERGNVEELRSIIAGLELSRTVLRANHSSNIVPLEARLPRDKERILSELDAIISSGSLDPNSPGAMPFSL